MHAACSNPPSGLGANHQDKMYDIPSTRTDSLNDGMFFAAEVNENELHGTP